MGWEYTYGFKDLRIAAVIAEYHHFIMDVTNESIILSQYFSSTVITYQEGISTSIESNGPGASAPWVRACGIAAPMVHNC